MAYKQHFIEWWTGRDTTAPNAWREYQISGSSGGAEYISNTDGAGDDGGGIKIKSGTGNAQFALDMNDKCQFNQDGCVMISVWSRNTNISGAETIKMGTMESNYTAGNVFYIRDRGNESTLYAFAKNGSGNTSTAMSTANTQNVWRQTKTELKSSSAEASCNGTLEATMENTHLPTVAQQPTFTIDNGNGVNTYASCRFMEIYNT